MYKNKRTLLYACIMMLHAPVINSMMDMAIMMGAQQGASIACETMNAMYRDMGISLQTDQSTIQNSLQTFSAAASQAESENAKLLSKIFTNALSHVSKEQTTQSDYTQQMQDYIDKAISLHKSAFYYILASATTFDQAFANGTMYTPKGPLWKNIFRNGDWEYDDASDSFYQFVKVPLFSTDTNTQKKSSAKASYNNIFTEYITAAKSYEIQCEITIYQTEYPFFVGIQFNKTRWISGNADSLTVSRLLGIYGSSNTSIDTYYAEQPSASFFATNTANNQTLMLSPLDQVIQQKTKQQASISPTLFDNIYSNPPTFVIRIATSPSKIQFKVWPKNSKEPSKFTTIKSIDPNLYLYHNIGFISPGAIAQFRLIKPTDLLFSKDARTEFSHDVKNLLASQ